MTTAERCAHCGLDVAAHAVRHRGQTFCGWYCSRAAVNVAAGEPDDAAVARTSVRRRIVDAVKRKAART
jgi:hypothetical protein